MNRYEIRCTEEQTKKALELGAPIYNNYGIGGIYEGLKNPTAEQMIGWLEEQGQSIEVCRLYKNNPNWSAFVDDTQIIGKYYPTRKGAIIAAIDAALEYLINNKEKI